MPRPRAVIAAKQAEQLAKAQASAGVVRHVKQNPKSNKNLLLLSLKPLWLHLQRRFDNYAIQYFSATTFVFVWEVKNVVLTTFMLWVLGTPRAVVHNLFSTAGRKHLINALTAANSFKVIFLQIYF